MKRWIGIAVVVLGSCRVMCAQPVYFADPELKAAVTAALGANPTVANMAGLTQFILEESDVSDLTGLEHAVNLKYLSLLETNISDLWPLAGLTKLESLVLEASQISDVSPLGGLTALRGLCLSANQISNVSALGGLTGLRILALNANPISDLRPLAGLTNLEILGLELTQISNVSPLGTLTALRELYLNRNQIRDLRPLVALRNLEVLALEQNQISDIAPLVQLIDYDLQVLFLWDNPLNQEAYDVYIPILLSAGISVNYDPLVKVAVPDVVGLSQAAAEQVLRDEGFIVWITNTASGTVPAYYVMSQEPNAGAQAVVGSDVTLTISTGPGGGPGPGPRPDLPTAVAHWALDETAGRIAADSAGSHNGQLRGGPVWLPAGGIIDGALHFDGAQDYVSCGTFNPSAATGKLTVCLWANWDGLTDWYQGLIGKRDAWDASQMMWQLEASLDTGTVAFFREGSGPRDGFVLPVGEWVHVAATCDGAVAKLYRDGRQVTSGPMTFGSDTAAGLVFGACQANGENPFKGTLDDVRLYDQVLSVEQIQAVMGGAGPINWVRATYWDFRYPTSWVRSRSVRDALAAAGYEILDADRLKTWMDARIADGKPSVVVFCQDVAPDTVYEAASSTCTLRQYLDAGGKIVWYGDIPLYYQGHSDGTRTSFGVSGSVSTLGFNAAGGTWDRGEQVTLTDEGRTWGLTRTWPSGRPAPGVGLRVLAEDSAGQAAGWVKHFVPGDTYRGFVRLCDCGATPGAEDVRRVAEYPTTTAAPGPGAGGLVAHWRLDGDATDSAGTSHGAVHGNPVWATGKVGTALRLDGFGDYVDCGNAPALSLTDQITVAAWVNIAAVHRDWKAIIAKGDSAWRLSTLPGRRAFHFAVGGPPSWPDVDGIREVASSQWHHVAGTYDGATIRLYVNGVLDATLPYAGGIDANTQPVFIGENSEMTGRTWQGLIDDVMVYNRALSADEISDLMAP